MFRMHRYKPERSGEKVPFKFFDFNVIQVPKGWDKLVVCIVSMETGRSVIKSSKATIRSGAGQWTDSLSESLWIAHDETTKDLEESLFKFVVSVGSSRSGILGEAVVNLADYMTSKIPVPACLPLKKCNAGTILQVKIHCLSPRIRDKEQTKEANSQLEDMNVEHDDMYNKSDGSDNVFNRSLESSSSNQFGGCSRPGEPRSRETSISLSGSHCSSDSGEGSVGLSASSPLNGISVGGKHNSTRRKDSDVSQNSTDDGNYTHDDPVRSNSSSFNSRHELASQSPSHRLPQLSLNQANASKDLMEAAEETIEELRSEVKMWERNARKLKIDLDTLKKGFSDQSKRLADLEMELSAARNERDGFKLKLDQMKLSLDDSVVKSPDSAKSRDQDFSCIQKELEDEIKFQKDSNAELSLQLTKTQESNLELVSILQELEQTVEKQKLEIEKFSAQREENDRQVNDLQVTAATSNEQVGRKDNPALEETVERQRMEIKLQMDSNADLSLQLTKSQESNIELVSILQELEQTVEKQKLEIEELSSQREENNKQVDDLQDTSQTSTEQMWRKDNLALEETVEKQRLEIKFQMDSNADLSLQLTKSQESNLELVSILQELEETVEKQKLEIEKLSAQREEDDEQAGDLWDTAGTSNEQRWRKDNLALEEIVEKQRLEIKFQQDSNADLSLQLAKTQESNIELVSILQELEQTVEKQRFEMEKLSAQREGNDERVGDLQDATGTSNEQMWRKDNLALEEKVEKQRLEIKFQMDSNADLSLQLTKSQESNLELVSILQELEETVEKQKLEIEKLSAQREEDEKDGDLQDIAGTSNEQMWRKDNLALEDLVAELEESRREMKSVVQSLEESLEEKNQEIELEKQLKKKSLKDIQEEWACKLSAKEGEVLKLESKLSNLLNTCSINGDDPHMMNEIVALRAKVQELEKDCNELTDENLELILKLNAAKETDNEFPELQNQLSAASTAPDNLHSFNSSENFPEMHKQLQLALATVKNSWSGSESHDCREYPDSPEFSPSSSGGRSNSKEQQTTMLNDLLELNNILRVKILEHKAFKEKAMLQEGQAVDAQKQLKDSEANRAMIAELEAVLLTKDEEIKFLSLSRVELEEKVSNLLEERNQLEENLEISQKKSSIAAKCLDDVRQDFTNSMDEQVSANKILERKSIELESSKHELEVLVSEMEEENVQLSERLSGLEAQLRHLTDERESTRLELERSRRLITDLKNEIEKLDIEMEMQKTDLKQKLQEAQEKCSEAEEESEISKRSYSKLQATVESLIEECNSLQKLNEELRRQRLKSHEYCAHLEAELGVSHDRFSESCQKIEALEENYSSLQKDVTSKENLLTSELQNLLKEHKKNEEKLILAESLLKQNNLEKAAEVESLQIEVAHLTAQIMATQDERERMASEAVLEVSNLRADKNKLENSLKKCSAKAKQYEDELCVFRLESENKLQGLTDIISAAEQNEELFMAERNRMKRSLEEAKSSEERLKKTLGETEVKLKALEYEKELSLDEIASLKDQLQDRVRLQDKISALKALLDETKYEKGKLETSLEALSVDFEEAKAERFSFIETLTYMQKALSEAEESVRNKVALEEKLLRLEGDLNAKEASCANDAELKNELSRIKRTNSQLQRRIHGLEEERDGYSKRVQALEEEFKLKRENRHMEDLQDLSESRDETSQESTQGKNELQKHEENQLVGDLELKIQLLETEVLEANKKDMTQLNGYADTDQNPSGKNFNKSAEEYEKLGKRVEALEAELKDMQDRYLHMSLKFAEVEAEREELVMKLKTSVKTERRWFS